MTSKEFNRRLAFYSNLDNAAYFFSQPENYDFIYRAVLVASFNRKSEQYCVSPTLGCFGESFIRDCISLYYDRFTRSDFIVQLRYFKAFFNRCSKRQQEYLSSTSYLHYLISFLKNES